MDDSSDVRDRITVRSRDNEKNAISEKNGGFSEIHRYLPLLSFLLAYLGTLITFAITKDANVLFLMGSLWVGKDAAQVMQRAKQP